MEIAGGQNMETGYKCVWSSDRTGSTGASPWPGCIPKYFLAASLLISAGTGAFVDDLNRLQQQRPNDSTISSPVKIYSIETTTARTPTEDMARIRNVLSPAMSDLAKSFNVSRQTIYNWLKGEQPTPEHIARLKDLALAADLFADAGVLMNGVLLKRKVIEGKNLFENIRDGGSARDTAQLLLQIIRHEISQRERLATRYAGRTNYHSADSDLMAENDAV